MKCDKKDSHRNGITIFIWIPVWRDHSGKVKKNSQTFCSLSKLQNQTTLKNSLQLEKPHPPIVWKSCEEWSLFDSTSHPEDISRFISTWSSLWSFDYTYRLDFHSKQWWARQGCLLHIVKELQILKQLKQLCQHVLNSQSPGMKSCIQRCRKPFQLNSQMDCLKMVFENVSVANRQRV